MENSVKKALQFLNKLLTNLLSLKCGSSISICFLLLFVQSCKQPTPPDDGGNKIFPIELSVVETSCTEAWVKLENKTAALPVKINLTINSSSVAEINLTAQDTIIYLDSLLPSNTYIFEGNFTTNSKPQTTNRLQIKTLDTTSSNYTWQTYTFGNPDYGSSILNDVAIIDENNIWAVGEIYNDSTGLPYNAVHWNGSGWKLTRIKTNACGGVDYPAIKAIIAFSTNDILFAHIDGSLTRYNGIEFINDCSLITQLNGSANKIWGKSRNDFYVVSGNGFIARYQNGQWSKIESGTTTDINDIWGYNNSVNGEVSVLCVASNILHTGELRLLSISNYTAHDTLNWPYSNHWLHSVWYKDKYSPVYIGGGGIKEYRRGTWKEIDVTNDFIECIRGSNVNDIFAVGDYGYIGHFNGLHWQSYYNFHSNDAAFLSVAVKNNTVAIVGYSVPGYMAGAVIIIGKR